jgi:hypothetical protein
MILAPARWHGQRADRWPPVAVYDASTAARDVAPLESELSGFTLSAFPGEALTKGTLERKRERNRLLKSLIKTILAMVTQNVSWTPDGDARISDASARTATTLLGLLPERKMLPRLGPDYEGGLIFTWEGPAGVTLLTVDDDKIHMIEHAMTAHAVYHDNLRFDQFELPSELLGAIPDA